ncbi:MAG: helicase-related protein [Candidatus Woesearchaeota archaeon]
MDEIQKLALETINLNKQAIIFTSSRLSAEKSAQDISKLTTAHYPELEQASLKALSTPTTQCRKLSHCLNKGIAFHHAGLAQKQKDLIEEEFKKGTIKIICATPTLAAGLSLPAYRVIIKSLKRFTGHGMDWIPVLEYLQMAGRAGRPEYEKEGQSIIISKDEFQKEEIYNKYICGVPEDIYSKLAVEPVLRTYLLSLISSGIIKNEQTMQEFFSKTFWAQQFGDMERLKQIMQKMLSLLEEWEFIKIDNNNNNNNDSSDKNNKSNNNGSDRNDKNNYNNDFIVASNLNSNPKEKKLLPTIIGKRISELYLDPLTAKHFLDCFNNYNSDKNFFSILQMITHTLELRPLLRVKVKEEEHIQELLVKNYNLLLKEEPSAFDMEYHEFINSIKTTLFFEAWINEKDEDFLLDNYDIRPGEIKAKLETADWLLYAVSELSKIVNNKEINSESNKLRIRIKHGVKEELLNLIKLKGIGRIRARKMFLQGIKDVRDLKKIDLTSLTQIIGKNIAEDIKKQVGEEIKEVLKGTRKGQLSMEKF